MATLLTEGEVALRLADAKTRSDGGETSPEIVGPPQGPKRFPLTSTVVDSLVGFIRNPTERWYLGFPEFDLATRGVGRGEVMMILGRSHTGKSQILLNSIVWNLVNHHDTHAVIFSLDEPRELVLMKMFCLLKGPLFRRCRRRHQERRQRYLVGSGTGSNTGTVTCSNS